MPKCIARVALLGLAALTTAAWCASAHAQASLPGWSGTWIPDIAGQNREERVNMPPWNPRAAARIAKQTADQEAGRPWPLFADCLPEGMPAWMLVSHNAMEILFTPGRVTLLGESDGNRLRRIHTDGRGHPKDPDPSFHGDSVGHWDGDTLVVDTIAVMPEALLAISEARGVPNDGDMHIVERLHAAGDVLTDDLTITAPHILTRPWTTTRRFTRQRGPNAEIEEGVCRQGDFIESKDADGFSVFAPLKSEGGNPIAPQLSSPSKDKAP